MSHALQWVICTYILLFVQLTTFGRLVERDGGACGWLFRWGSAWVGWHWSPHNRRLCVNILPCLTFWIMFRGGHKPCSSPA